MQKENERAKQYIVTGMSCAACASRVEKAVSAVPGARDVSVSLLTGAMAVRGNASPADVIKAVESAGYGASLKAGGGESFGDYESMKAEEEALRDTETPKMLRRLIISAVWLALLMYISMGHNMAGWPLPPFLDGNYPALAVIQMVLAAVVIFINRAFYTGGYKSLFRGGPNMDTLVALGSSVSFVWSVYILVKIAVLAAGGSAAGAAAEAARIYRDNLYFETAAMIPTLITVGKTLEAFSKGRTRDALASLLRMAPKTASVERDGVEITLPASEVRVGDIFIVRAGGEIPVDGIITDGAAAIDESALTGESVPADKKAGDRIFAATVNKNGFIKARALRVGADTAFAKIVRLVDEASATKAPVARAADKVAGVFVPAVMGIALIVCVIWLLTGAGAEYSLLRAVSVLVISCPCALGLATPVAIMVGSGVGARCGILFKSAEALENTGRVKIIALDKTGTITAGENRVTDVVPADGVSEEELLNLAYSLEIRSAHPLAAAVTLCAESLGITPSAASCFEERAGLGLSGEVSGTLCHGGSREFIESYAKINPETARKSEELKAQGKTPLFFERGGALLGIIAAADTVRDDSAEAVEELRKMGLEIVMLTGDNERTAKAVGERAGVNTVIAGVLPDGKEKIIRELKNRGKTAMVGDGINDAPALAGADVGIAIGAGTDVAIDSADVVLMNSKLSDVSAAVRLSKATLRDIYQNLFWAFAYNVVLIPMAAGAIPNIEINPMWAAAAMALSSFCVCMNALRLNLVNIRGKRRRDEKLGEGSRGKGSLRKEKNENQGEPQPGEKNENQGGTRPGSSGFKEPEETIGGGAEKSGGKSGQDEKGEYTMTETVKIEGMMCSHCEETVRKALEAIDGVESAEVSRESKSAVITLSSPVSDDALKAAVEGADFTYIGTAKEG